MKVAENTRELTGDPPPHAENRRLTTSEFCWRGPSGRKAEGTTAYTPEQVNG
jgi:hypothetical protein